MEISVSSERKPFFLLFILVFTCNSGGNKRFARARTFFFFLNDHESIHNLAKILRVKKFVGTEIFWRMNVGRGMKKVEKH